MMKIGDLVFANYDEQRGIQCIGLVLEVERREVKVMWSSKHSPIGWWREDQLRLVSESR
jgi:hypothetical protein